MYHGIAGGHALSGIVLLGVAPLSAVTGSESVARPGGEIPKLPSWPVTELRASEPQSTAATNRRRELLPDLRQAKRRRITARIVREGTLVHHRARIHKQKKKKPNRTAESVQHSLAKEWEIEQQHKRERERERGVCWVWCLISLDSGEWCAQWVYTL